jgi:hypothetical protein
MNDFLVLQEFLTLSDQGLVLTRRSASFMYDLMFLTSDVRRAGRAAFNLLLQDMIDKAHET